MPLFGEGPPSCTIDGGKCEGFEDGHGSWYHWVGLRTSDNFGQGTCCGCDLGYRNCLQDSNHVGSYRAREEGDRWIKPSLVLESRDARGMHHDLRSREPHPILGVVNYDVAPCHTGFGGECFGVNLCGCDQNVMPCGFDSPNCTGIGEPCLGLYADTFGYVGSQWLPGSRISCRETTQYETRLIRMEPESLMQAALMRLDIRSLSRPTSCTSNRMALCIGTNVDNPCSYSNPPDSGFYMGQHVNIYSFANIAYNNIGLRERTGLSPAALIALNIKRMALAKAMSFPSLSQIDSFAAAVGPSVAGNGFLAYWSRDWGVGIPLDQRVALGTFATYPNCRLSGSGCPVVVDLYVTSARIEMSLVPHMTYNTDLPLTEREKMFVFARFRLSVRIGAVARIVGECSVQRAWRGDTGPTVLAIANDEMGEVLPVVMPVGEDAILFIDGSGTLFVPPSHADWLGYRGHFGVDGISAVTYVENENNLLRCCELAKELHGTEVRGWPYDIGSSVTDYDGHITIGLTDTGNFCGSCGNNFPDICGGGGGGGGGKIPPVGIQPSERIAVPFPDEPQTPDLAQPVPPADLIPGGPTIGPPDLLPSPPSAPVPNPPERRPPNELTPLPSPPPGGRDRSVVENDPPIFLV